VSDQRPVKVAIIGGGCASVAAAFELSRPEHQGKYQITVYQLGWRLGGKGASGRGPATRIEEHGFHVWMGYYENSFRLMRECYRELGRNPRKCRIAEWRDAFFPAPFIGLTQRSGQDSYWNFLSYFPPGDGLPGDPLAEHNSFTIPAYLNRAVSILRTMLSAVQARRSNRVSRRKGAEFTGAVGPEGSPGTAADGPRDGLYQRIASLLKVGLIATTAGLIEAAGILQIALTSRFAHPDSILVQLLETMAAGVRRQIEALLDDDPDLLILWQSIDLVVTSVLGILRFGLISDPSGFDAINDYDFREWLRINGATQRLLDSPLVRGTYDLMFAYEDGDYQRPRYAAGVTLRCALRMLFSSRGAIFWKMRAGMGDIVFAPFYQVLKRRGVAFQFFHRLTNVKLGGLADAARGEGGFVEALEFDVQARTRNDEYQPLVDIDGLPGWPSQPDFSQLVDGDRFQREEWNFESHWNQGRVATRTLRVADDFDLVVLGVGLGAVPYVCQDLIRSDRRWRAMVEHLKTVATQSFQIWMRDDMEALGWSDPPVSLSGFVQPFETWADMRHLIKEERWPVSPGAIAYFCSPLGDSPAATDISDSGYPAARREEVRRNAIRFLNRDIVLLWPRAVRSSGEFRWDLLMDPGEKTPNQNGSSAGESRFDSQYWRANIDPTDRYVLSLPGTQKYRISPLDNTYNNLSITGDWTACGLDAGCVEAAVMSGRLAAHALSGLPSLESIIGYDHP